MRMFKVTACVPSQSRIRTQRELQNTYFTKLVPYENWFTEQQRIQKMGGKIVGYACIIDRSNGKSLIKDKIVSQVQLSIPTYTKENLPKELIGINAIKPGSRNL